MADVVLTRLQIVRTGLTSAFQSLNATDVYFFQNQEGEVYLHVKNTGGSISVVTFDLTQLFEGSALVDPTVSIPATTGDKLIGPFPSSWEVVGGANNGQIKFSQNQASGVTAAAVRL